MAGENPPQGPGTNSNKPTEKELEAMKPREKKDFEEKNKREDALRKEREVEEEKKRKAERDQQEFNSLTPEGKEIYKRLTEKEKELDREQKKGVKSAVLEEEKKRKEEVIKKYTEIQSQIEGLTGWESNDTLKRIRLLTLDNIKILLELLKDNTKKGRLFEEAKWEYVIDQQIKLYKRESEKTTTETPPPPAPTATITPAEKKIVDEKFKNSGFTAANIEGIETLSYGERLLMLEMLQNEALRDVKEGALKKYEEKNSKKIRLIGGVRRSIRRTFKNYNIAKEEKNRRKELFETNGTTVESLLGADQIKGIKTQIEALRSAGIGIHGTPEGSYGIDFVKSPEGGAHAEAYKAFNEAATKLTKIPDEWGAEYATDKQKAHYKAAYAEYTNARTAMAAAIESESSKEQAVIDTATADAYTKLVRFNIANPDAMKELEAISKTNAFAKAIKTTVSERGVYFALGAGMRTLFKASGLGIVAAPVVGALSGAAFARKRELEAKRQRDIAMRGKGGINTKDRNERFGIETLKQKIEKEPNDAKRKELEDDLKKRIDAKKIEDDREKAFVSAENLAKRLEHLQGKIQNVDLTDAATRAKYLADLKNRIDYTKSKLDEGHVSLGEVSSRAGNQVALIVALTQAEALYATANNKEFSEALAEYYANEKQHRPTALTLRVSSLNKKLQQAGLSDVQKSVLEKEIAEIEKNISIEAGEKRKLKEGKPEDVKNKLRSYMEMQAKRTELVRRADRETKMLVGAATGAVAAIAGRYAAEYLMELWQGDDIISRGGGSTNPIENPGVVDNTPGVTEYTEAKVGVSSRGSIQTFVDLKKELALRYPAGSDMPPAVRHILNTDATTLSKEVGYFRPTDSSGLESHMAHAGDEYRINKQGDLVFFDKSSGTERIIIDSNNGAAEARFHSDAEMFDSDGNRRPSGVKTNEGGARVERSGAAPDEPIGGREDTIPDQPIGDGKALRQPNGKGLDPNTLFEKDWGADANHDGKIDSVERQRYDYPINMADPKDYGTAPKIATPGVEQFTPSQADVRSYQSRMGNYIDNLPAEERQRVLDMDARQWGEYQRSMNRTWGGRAWRNATWGMGKFFKWLFAPTGQGGYYGGGVGPNSPIYQNGTGPGVNQTVGQWLKKK